MTTRENYFNCPSQERWNNNRVSKLVDILGKDWFQNKNILEVGCGHGQNGSQLIKLGANVTFTDGREMFVNWLKEDGLTAFVMDNDKPWSVSGKFDLIIHWGLLYHLDNWKQDLDCTFEASDLICLETEIYDNPSEFEKKVDESGYDQALNEKGTLLSATSLENYFTEKNMLYKRYDDRMLNAGIHHYDWIEGTVPNGFVSGQRRFYLIWRESK